MNNRNCADCGTAWNRSWGWGSDLCPECVEDAAARAQEAAYDAEETAVDEGEYS